MFPFVLFAGLAALVLLSRGSGGKTKALPSGSVTITSVTKTGAAALSPDLRYLKRLQAIRVIVKGGNPVPRQLLDCTIAEAYDRGDWKVIAALTPGDDSVSNAIAGEVEGEDMSSEPAMDASKPIEKSPIDDASDEEWGEFVTRLKSEKPDFSTEKHLGAYRHNRERLAQLGIDAATLTDEASQRKAIADDLAQYRDAESKLIDDFGGDMVEVDGTTHPVTASGVLGVLKAAGPKHARSWLKNPEERKQFPHTTETFLRTNGIF